MSEPGKSHGVSPYRHALAEMTSVAKAAVTREPESSVTITRNARGVFQFEVTVRGEDATACAMRAANLSNDLAQAYPYPSEAPGAPESPQEPPTPIRRPRGRAAS